MLWVLRLFETLISLDPMVVNAPANKSKKQKKTFAIFYGLDQGTLSKRETLTRTIDLLVLVKVLIGARSVRKFFDDK
jgi:hypothetical protein